MTSFLADLLLLQLADSSLPTGSFAYSSGLEGIIEFGMLETEDDLENYIYDFLIQTISFEFPYFKSIYEVKAANKIVNILEQYDASFSVAAMYQGSIEMGKNLLRVLEQVLERHDIVEELKGYFLNCNIPFHYLMVLGVAFERLGIDLQKLLLYHANNTLRDQVSCAVRTGAIGSMYGNKLHHQLHRRISKFVSVADLSTIEESFKTGFIPDVGQMLQKNVYSKLFRN